MFHSSLRISGMDLSSEEAECYVAIMIAKGYMKGYISHEMQMVVMATTNTFPNLADRANPLVSL
jgi:COP9 signalosome complex subunit 12